MIVELSQLANAIQTKDDFAKFVAALVEDLEREPESWENRDLKSYLDAVASWVRDMDGYYHNKGLASPDRPTWKTLGQILAAARVYE
jgi:predicted ATPase